MKKFLYILTLALALAACKKQPVLDVDKPSLEVETAGGTLQVNVTANYPWTAASSESWIKLKYTEGESLLTVTVSANNATDGRQGTITLKSEELTKTIPVSQKQRDAIELDAAGRLTVDAEAQQLEIRLRSNVDMTASVTEGADWVKVLSTKAMTAHTVTLAIQANEQRTMRRALVSFSDKSGKISQQVMIDQDGKPQILRVSFRDVKTFQVPLMSGIQGAALSGLVFWDGADTGETYAPTLSRSYDGKAGSMEIQAHNAGSLSFANVKGLEEIDLLEF